MNKRRNRHNPEQIIYKLRDAILNAGKDNLTYPNPVRPGGCSRRLISGSGSRVIVKSAEWYYEYLFSDKLAQREVKQTRRTGDPRFSRSFLAIGKYARAVLLRRHAGEIPADHFDQPQKPVPALMKVGLGNFAVQL